MEEFYIYRAIPEKDIKMYPATSDLLSEAMSRVIASSGLNKTPYFICWTEDPRIALKYATKAGYSGKIARIRVKVLGEKLLIEGNENAELYRTWHMADWIYLAKKSDFPYAATNLNYKTNPQKRIEDVITYQGRMAARAFAHSDKGFILHSEIPFKYEILSEADIAKLLEIKQYYLRSYRLLKYDFSDVASQTYIKKLLAVFKQRERGKAYNRIIVKQLEELVA